MQCCVVQVATQDAMLPPESLKMESIKSMPEFEQFEIVPENLHLVAQFQKGQHIAKAWQQEEGDWTYYAARINSLTKEGPYAYFLADGQQVLQKDLSRENYGKLWVFLKKTEQALRAEEAAAKSKETAKKERQEAARIRDESKRKREEEAQQVRDNRPKRESQRGGALRAAAMAAEEAQRAKAPTSKKHQVRPPAHTPLHTLALAPLPSLARRIPISALRFVLLL